MILRVKDCDVSLDDDHGVELEKYSWYIKKGYAIGTLKKSKERKRIMLHRLVMKMPVYERGIMVDHINRNKLDNRRQNLRVVDHSMNIFNRDTPNGKYRGTYWVGHVKRWAVLIELRGKRYGGGKTFESREDARIVAEGIIKSISEKATI